MPERRSSVTGLWPSHGQSPLSFPANSVSAAHVSAVSFRRWRRAAFGATAAILVMLGGGGVNAQSLATQLEGDSAVCAPFASFITKTAQRFHIPGTWICAVLRAESFGNAHAVSSKGAMGLMQIMPETWAALRQRYGLGADPYDAHDNIVAGGAYLRELYDRYGASGFLAAYNAGPARWEDHLTTGQALPAETQAYLAHLSSVVQGSVVANAVVVTSAARPWTEAALFPASSARSPSRAQAALIEPSSRPSSDRSVQDWTALAPQSEGLFIAISAGSRSR